MKKRILFIILLIVFVLSFFLDNYMAINITKIRNLTLTQTMLFISLLGNTISSFIVSLLLLIYFIYAKKDKRYIPSLFLSLIISVILVNLLKQLVQRPRPSEILDIIALEEKNNFSFPSGHTNAVFTLFPFIEIHFKKFKIIWLSFSILVAFSRIYLGVHYLSDVVFSVILGLSISYLFIYIERKYRISNLFFKKQ
ncbi:phosphatase PAP2 family protein [Candidatus Woesearchaeota archaeon]|nr:phosphatase PAP2 family protein [Candidatus Woesearchaeota archaeon]